ncbi:MAG: hypothetical protein ACLQVM_01680 [Terriglobia bacterium]
MNTVQIPVYREWSREDKRLDREKAVLEFRLVYQGLLPSSGDSSKKQSIRRYLHRQLYNVWRTKHPLMGRKERVTLSLAVPFVRWSLDDLADKYALGGKRYLWIVPKEF